VVSFAGTIIGFAGWNAARGLDSLTKAWLAVDPISPMGELGFDVLLDAVFRDVSAFRPSRILVDTESANRAAMALGEGHGFRRHRVPNAAIPAFEKYCIGRIITSRNWKESIASLSSSLGINLPATPTPYAGAATTINVTKADRSSESLPLGEFEAAFGPVILMLPDRPVVVVPIQRSYADQLLNTAYQHSLFPRPEASVLGEKLYLSSPRALSVLTNGAIILFYESMGTDGGRGSIVAAAQVSRTAIREAASLDPNTMRRGVLSAEEVQNVSSGDKTGLTFFNQLFRFENPINLARLRTLGCADGANFVTAKRIDEASASIIIEEGKPSVRLS
jgi:hypothetical protein